MEENMEAVHKDMTIGELVQKFPSLAEILTEEGVHCVGCGAAYFETIEQGLMGHGRTDEEVAEIVKKLNDAIPKTEGNSELTITENAAVKAKELLSKKAGYIALRVRVTAGGCAGSKYSFSFEKEEKKDDNVITVSGVNFFVDQHSLEVLQGSKIDYLDTLNDSGFRISNPKAKSTCGCGSSFS